MHEIIIRFPYCSSIKDGGGSLVQLLGSWAPNPRVGGSIPTWPCCCDLEQVTSSLLLLVRVLVQGVLNVSLLG